MTNLPEMTNGTEKQIEYARKIRATLILTIGLDMSVEKMTEFVALLAINTTTDAVTWIEASEIVLIERGEALHFIHAMMMVARMRINSQFGKFNA